MFKYRRRDSTNPEENFFTEGLAFLLKNDRSLLKNLLLFIKPKFDSEWSLPSSFAQEAYISTQESHKSEKGEQFYLDLQIKSDNIVLWFEVKVGSILPEYQIKNYDRLMEEKKVDKKNSGIIILAKSPQKVNSKYTYFRGQILWSEIYIVIENHVESGNISETQAFLEESYLQFIEERGMRPFKPFKKSEQDVAGTMTLIDTKVNNILIHFKEELRNIYGKEFKVLKSSRSDGPGYIGQKVQAGQIEAFYAIVTDKDKFGSLDIWFYPNPDQEEKIRRSEIGLKKIGFEEKGGNFLYRSLDYLQVFENDNYPNAALDLLVKKLEELNKMLS